MKNETPEKDTLKKLPETGKSGKKTRHSTVAVIVFCLSLGIFLFSTIKLIAVLTDYQKDKSNYDDIRSSALSPSTTAETTETETTSETETEDTRVLKDFADYSSYEHEESLPFLHTKFDYILATRYELDFDALNEMNQDVCAWIIINDTPVNYPVVQGTDNDYYLRTAADGTPNNAGSIFMDYRNSQDFTDQNTILYGHNQQSRQMFHQLLSYKDPDFLAEHPFIDIYREDGTMLRYHVFASFETGEYFPYWTEFSDDDDFQDFLDSAQEAAYYDSGVKVTTDDKILTLVTCTAYYNEEHRVITMAVLVQGE